MPETRRTNSGFLSNNEAARERQRTQDFVKGIVEAKTSESKNKVGHFEIKFDTKKKQENLVSIGQDFWSSNKGLIVRAIVLDRAYSKDTILRATQLKDEDYRQAATELFQAKLLTEKSRGNLWVTRELYWQCQSFFQQNQKQEDIDEDRDR